MSPRLCRDDNWSSVLDDPAPRAVRWAHGDDRFRNPVWTKWHYTEGNGSFTACGRSVIPFLIDGSPQESDTAKTNCKACKRLMLAATPQPPDHAREEQP